jgi:hypothetical protein
LSPASACAAVLSAPGITVFPTAILIGPPADEDVAPAPADDDVPPPPPPPPLGEVLDELHPPAATAVTIAAIIDRSSHLRRALTDRL